jgi:nucleotide-binding universal stress UspA family protein
MLPIRRILHPTDFSEHSGPAFQFACALARDYASELLILHVVPPAFLAGPEGVAVTGPSDEVDRAREQLEAMQPASGPIVVGRRLVEGAAAEEILKVANSANADLIVMGTHGHSGLRRVLMGSVAEAVMREAPCPVVTVKPPPPRG